MRKFNISFFIVVIIISLLVFSSCTENNDNTNSNETNEIISENFYNKNGEEQYVLPIHVEYCEKDDISEDLCFEYTDEEYKALGLESIIFTTDTSVNDFKFISVSYVENDYKAGDKLYSIGEFASDEAFVAHTIIGEGMALRGISFVDENGVTRYYAIIWSGYDGTISLLEFGK